MSWGCALAARSLGLELAREDALAEAAAFAVHLGVEVGNCRIGKRLKPSSRTLPIAYGSASHCPIVS